MESEQSEEVAVGGNLDVSSNDVIPPSLEHGTEQVMEDSGLELGEHVQNEGSDILPTNSEQESLPIIEEQESLQGPEMSEIEGSIENSEQVLNDEQESDERMEEDSDLVGDHDEDENDATSTSLPVGRVKKIMKICVQTHESELEGQEESVSSNKKKGGGKAKAIKKPGNMLLSKEAIYLTTVATELFVAAVTQQSSKITASSKKKTMTIDHLKRAVTDNESYEFLQGCLTPSIIIGE